MRQADLQQDVCPDAGRHPGLPVTAVRRDDRRPSYRPPEDRKTEVLIFLDTISDLQY